MHSKIFLPLALLAFAAPATNGAADAPLDRATLRGLTGLNVIVDQLEPDLEKEGMNREALRSQIEGRLKSGGFSIDRNSVNFLALRVLAVRSKRGPYALAMTIGLYQPVLLSRNKEVRTSTQTWEVQTILMTGPKELSGSEASATDELTDRFVSAYRSVNPK